MKHGCRFIWCLYAGWLALVPPALAGENRISSVLERLEVYPEQVELRSVGQRFRILVSVINKAGRSLDATRVAQFESLDPGVVSIRNGQLVAVAPGTTDVRVSMAGESATIPVVCLW